jgi:hypothetical protein
VVEPEVGHEIYEGRLSIPYITRSGIVNMKFRCMEPHDCKEVGCPKYMGLSQQTNIYNVGAFFADSPILGMAEGEIDTQVLDGLVGIPTVGIPGVKNWKPHYERCFSDYERVLVFVDGDEAGRDFAKHVQYVLEDVTPVWMPSGMDVSSVYQAEGPDGLRKRAGL